MYEFQIFLQRRRRLLLQSAGAVAVAIAALFAVVPSPHADAGQSVAPVILAATPLSNKTIQLLLTPYPVSSAGFVTHMELVKG